MTEDYGDPKTCPVPQTQLDDYQIILNTQKKSVRGLREALSNQAVNKSSTGKCFISAT